jgi:hypothetical protein
VKLEDLLLNGAAVSEPLREIEVTLFRNAIVERLADAKNKTNHNPSRLDNAYTAILDCALLSLRVEGLRTKAVQGHHRYIIESLAETMGIPAGDIDYFLDLSRTRGQDIYQPQPVTDEDAEEAIEAATELARKLDRWLEGRGIRIA